MGLFDRLMRRKAQEGSEVDAPPCPHTALGPRWDNASDIGDESKASSFRCEACGETFTREQTEQIRADEVERLKSTLSRDD